MSGLGIRELLVIMVGSSDRKISSATAATLVISISSTIALSAALYYTNRIRRSKWMSEEDAQHGNETTHSVIDHFKSLVLDPETTVEEANKRRTTRKVRVCIVLSMHI